MVQHCGQLFRPKEDHERGNEVPKPFILFYASPVSRIRGVHQDGSTRKTILRHARKDNRLQQADRRLQKLQQIIRREEIGDDSPSKFLRRLLSLTEDTVDNQTIVEIWSSRLPKEVNALIQSMLPEEDVNKLASLADHVYNVIYQSAAAVQAVQKPVYQTPTNNLEERMSRLERLLENLYI
jgi:hypothetical protein